MLKGKKLKKLRNIRSIFNHEVPQSTKSNARNSSYSFGRDLDLLTFSNKTPPSFPLRKRRGFAAFIPVKAGPAIVAVESIGTFLQKKHNKALSKGVKTIKY